MEKEEKVRYSRLKIGERKEGFLKEDQIWQHIHSFFIMGKIQVHISSAFLRHY